MLAVLAELEEFVNRLCLPLLRSLRIRALTLALLLNFTDCVKFYRCSCLSDGQILLGTY